MAKNIDLTEIAENNPLVNVERLEEARRMREKLRQIGSPRGRRPLSPSERRRVRIEDDILSDPKAIRLRRSSGRSH
jgi:hypothetical protein